MRQGRGASTLSIDFMEKVMAWAVTVLKVCIAGFVVSTLYVLYGVYGGHLAQGVEPRIIENLRIMGQVMAASGALGTLCLVILTHEEVAFAVAAGMLGAGMIFGFPLMVAGQVRGGAERAAQVITSAGTTTGQLIVVIVGFRILWEIVRFISEAPSRRARIAEEEGVEKPKTTIQRPWWRLSRCWEMPFCHEAIRDICPAYKQRKNCWRIGRGCNCDPYLIESLLRRGAGTDSLPEDSSEYTRSDLSGARQAGKERTRQCRTCPIFIEHQRQKFRVLNPIVIVATLVGIVFAYPFVRRLYGAFIAFMAKLAERFAFGTQVPVDAWIKRLDSPAVWVFFFIIVALLALSYVLKAVEWAVLVRKIV